MSSNSLKILQLVLRDLVENHSVDIERTRAGSYYSPDLRALHNEVEALPASALNARPFSDELAEVDRIFKGFGRTLHLAVEAILQYPLVSREEAQAASRVRDAFVPATSELAAPYPIKVQRCLERRPRIEERREDLERLHFNQIPLREIVDLYFASAQDLEVLLQRRAQAMLGKRRDAGVLRCRAISTLTRFRRDLRKEIERDPTLSRDLEQVLFAYSDSLAATSRASRKGAKSSEE